MHRFGKGLLLICCLWLLTGPQLILQLTAWSWMLASYSQQSSLEQAIIETFGGDRPCEICKFIQTTDDNTPPKPEQKSSERQSFKLMPTQTSDLCILPDYSITKYPPPPKGAYPSLCYEVPTPPPRLV